MARQQTTLPVWHKGAICDQRNKRQMSIMANRKILVISDIHGNAEALRAVLAADGDADHVIFLGDALLSGPQANETADLLNGLNIDLPIMGNHDEEMLDPSLFANWPAEWVALNQSIIECFDRELKQPLETYLPAGQYELAGLDMFLHHGKPKGSYGAALPDASNDVFLAMGGDCDSPLVLFGHTHVQFTKKVGGKTYINPGSVGGPRCGRLHACYGVFEGGEYFPRQVSYDPAPWLDALDRLAALDPHPEFRQWLRDGLLKGYGIGEKEPWTRFAAEGYC